jgi:CDGSH-type Zn-finger protein/uncharacterized Fe-S cluster protein YjdI
VTSGKIHTYTAREATVTWDSGRCIHAAECVRRTPQSFDPGARPWIVPDNARADALADAVNACPSGALEMRYADGASAMATYAANTCDVRADGPYYFRGTLVLAPGTAQTRLALCRCGASANKPFCDNSHKNIGFTHATALPVAKSPPPDVDVSAAMTVTPTRNGPLQVRGPLTIRDAAGAGVFVESAHLCRCGGSSNKPYCDGTHVKIGFKDNRHAIVRHRLRGQPGRGQQRDRPGQQGNHQPFRLQEL